MAIVIGRREFISALGLAATSPLAARAQQPAMPVVGFLHAGSADGFASEAAAFRQGLREVGYVEGQNAAIEYRWADGRYDQLPALAADLVRQHVAVIAAATFPAALAAKEATDALPIVFEIGVDPVRVGFVASLNRPGSNVTGIFNMASELVPKRIELARELVPNATLITVLVNPANPNVEATIREGARAAQMQLGIRVQILQASTISEIDRAFARVLEQRPSAVVFGADPYFNSVWREIAELAIRYAVPTIHELRYFIIAGGLMSYGADLADAYRLAGAYTGRILKGERPADLPVQQSTKVEMVINLKAAKALGLTVPLSLLGRADEVIE
jgi:putative ABC transport system substrate-binding protein